MAKINPHYSRLSSPYIFPVIEEKMAALAKQGNAASVINLGIGDIALPLAPAIVTAICSATEEMGRKETQRGYGPSEGYPFLRETIAQNSYRQFGITAEEIFISDGTNSDTANIQELFALDCTVAIADPTYPVYLATNIMAGRGDSITLLPCTTENGFLPQPPDHHVDIIFLCSPSNPTGVALNREAWERWIAYAQREQAIIVHDHAYSAFIRSPDVPRSVYEIPGAAEVAIECCSFSKAAGFTGLRCAYAVVPRTLPHHLHAMWKKRQTTKSNGVAYPIQRGAEASYTPEGKLQVQQQVASYGQQAELLYKGLKQLGYSCYGGIDAPYVWWPTPAGVSSWEFFDQLLEKCHLLTIPGQGFGPLGEGYVRLSAFTTSEKAHEALRRIRQL
jgi:LL-diaminopimelate aminotransferase